MTNLIVTSCALLLLTIYDELLSHQIQHVGSGFALSLLQAELLWRAACDILKWYITVFLHGGEFTAGKDVE